MNKDHEIIARDSFLYYNSKGRAFVKKKLLEQGIPESQIESVFEEYLQIHHIKSDRKLLDNSGLNWPLLLVGIFGVAVSIYLYAQLNKAPSGIENIEGTIAEKVKELNDICPYEINKNLYIQSAKMDSSNRVMQVIVIAKEYSSDEIILRKNEISNAVVTHINGISKYGNGYVSLIQMGYGVKFIIMNKTGRMAMEIIKNKDSLISPVR